MAMTPPSYSREAFRYFTEHAIDPEIAAVLGVTEHDGALSFPYRDTEGVYRRRRPLNGNRTFQPKGRPLVPWVPCERDRVALVCEGESDLLAVMSILYEVANVADEDDEPEYDLFRRDDLPPALDVVPIAIPGAGAAHDAVARLLDGMSDAFIALDGDDAGRRGALKLKAAIDATNPPSPACIVELPDGKDIADCLAAADDPVEWLANAVADADAAAGGDISPPDEVRDEEQEKPTKPGRTIAFPTVEPWPDPVKGSDVADQVRDAVSRHVAVSQEAVTAIALWILFAHVHDSSSISPILAVTSPTKRCGKTTTLNVIDRLAPRPLPSVNITTAALFRVIEAVRPTLLVDEADTFLGAKEELRGILNSGHHRTSAFVIRTVGDGANAEVRQFSTWAPKVLAAIGDLPDTLADRSVTIRLERRTATEHVEPLRLGDDRHDALRRQVVRWAEDNPEAAGREPALPSGLHDRAADNWRPLISIADGLGGEWAERARTAAAALEGAGESDDSTGTLLLADLRDLFDQHEDAALPTSTILEALEDREDRPWPEWSRGKALSGTGLAKLLRPFGVRPRNIKFHGDVLKGYRRDQLEEVWKRYLPSAATPLLATVQAGNGGSQPATPFEEVAAPTTSDSAPRAGSSEVAAANGKPGGLRELTGEAA